MCLWVHSDSDHPQWELDILSKSSPALFRQPHCRWTPVWLSECLTRKSWYPACMEMDNCCCCSFYLHIHLFATPTTWHLVWYHVECRDIHASSHTQDWCPATLWFWLLVWIIILQRHIFLDYLPPLSLIEETFRLCWQFAKQNQEANRLAMRLHELLKTATTITWQDNLNRFWHFLIYKSIRTVHWRTWTTIIIKDNQLERHKMDFFS